MDLNQVLIESAKDGNILVLKTALEKGADINAKDSTGMTALMYAIKRGNEEIVNFLKEKGAEKEEIDFWIAYFKSGEHQKAIDDYSKAIELNPQYAYAYYNRGIAHNDLGEHQKAIDDYYQAGILNLKQNNKTQALKCIDLMKKIDPSSQLIYKLQDLIDQI